MTHKIEHSGYIQEPANVLTVGANADGEPKFEGPKMPNDAEARAAALKAWEKANEPTEVTGFPEWLPFHLGFPWRCGECFEGFCNTGDFPTVKLTTAAADLGPCSRCGCDLSDGGAWMNLWAHEGEGKTVLPTALYVVTSVKTPARELSQDDIDDTPF